VTRNDDDDDNNNNNNNLYATVMGGWDQNGFWGEWCGFNWLKIGVGGGLL
jgi:hypothetical protein